LLFVEEEYPWAWEVQQYLDVKYEKILFLLAYYYKDNRMNRNYERTLLDILHNNSISIEAMQQLMEFYIEYNKLNLFRKQYQAYKEVLLSEFNENPLFKYREYYENLD
jgi:two-component SAPR family response regulator